MLAACEKAPTDAVQLNYDPRNPFDVCSLTFTPIYRGNKVRRGAARGAPPPFPPFFLASCGSRARVLRGGGRCGCRVWGAAALGQQAAGSARRPPPPPLRQYVEDPYTKARFQPECEGQISPVGELSRIGLDASGLVCSPTQLR